MPSDSTQQPAALTLPLWFLTLTHTQCQSWIMQSHPKMITHPADSRQEQQIHQKGPKAKSVKTSRCHNATGETWCQKCFTCRWNTFCLFLHTTGAPGQHRSAALIRSRAIAAHQEETLIPRAGRWLPSSVYGLLMLSCSKGKAQVSG